MWKIFAFIKLKLKILFDIVECKKMFLPISMEQAIIDSEINKEELIQFKLPISNQHVLRLNCGIKKYKESYKIYDPNFGSVNMNLEEDVYNIFKSPFYEQDKLKISESVLLETRKQLNNNKFKENNMAKYKVTDLYPMLNTNDKDICEYVLDYWFNEEPEQLIQNIETILKIKNDEVIKYYIFLLEETLNYIHFEELLEIYNKVNKIFIEGKQKDIERIKSKLINFIDWFSKTN